MDDLAFVREELQLILVIFLLRKKHTLHQRVQYFLTLRIERLYQVNGSDLVDFYISAWAILCLCSSLALLLLLFRSSSRLEKGLSLRLLHFISRLSFFVVEVEFLYLLLFVSAAGGHLVFQLFCIVI